MRNQILAKSKAKKCSVESVTKTVAATETINDEENLEVAEKSYSSLLEIWEVFFTSVPFI